MSCRRLVSSTILLSIAFLAAPAAGEELSVSRSHRGVWVISDRPGPHRLGIPSGDDSSWLVAQRNRSTPWDELIASISHEHDVDPILVKCMMAVESGFNPRATSNKGARGLMQLMPGTAKAYGVKDIFDPAENIRGGVRYLNFLLNYFSGNLNLAIAGYNAGEHAVARYGAVPPYDETRDYVRKVLTAFNGSPFLSMGGVRTNHYRKIDVTRDPGRPVFAWYDAGSEQRILSARRPPNASLRLRRLVRGR